MRHHRLRLRTSYYSLGTGTRSSSSVFPGTVLQDHPVRNSCHQKPSSPGVSSMYLIPSQASGLAPEPSNDVTSGVAAAWVDPTDWLVSSNFEPRSSYTSALVNQDSESVVNTSSLIGVTGDHEKGLFYLHGHGTIPHAVSRSQDLPSHQTHVKLPQCTQRVQIDYGHLHDLCHSPTSPLDLNCRKLLSYILNSEYYLSDGPEPEIGSDKASTILSRLEETEGVTFPQHWIKRGAPLSALLTDPKQRKCLICEGKKSTAQRAIECVRSHIGYRPYHCGGTNRNCPRCRQGQR
ncbi:hypothetical protein CPB86DRAFT_88365 [Serendipita vermifera]|nr:hypothetical protein CPB86DRAFT_88365 [Serendipita vermifera]